MLEVTVYRKPGCGLCDQAEATLARIAKRLPLRVVEVNIEENPTLRARYAEHIPVIAVGEREVARAPITEATLEAALRDVR
ncbi:MAG: glutaredoxin family protein [Dehalococcoidia bacterium]